MRRLLYLGYGVLSYAVFFATYLYAIGFIGGFVTPTSLDGEPTAPLSAALAVNLGLLALFAVQHSVMARPTFKRWWTRFVPRPIERATYTLFSSLALVALFAWWQPMGGSVWTVTSPVAAAVLHGIMLLGFLIVLVTTFLIDHFDLFGLRQVWLYYRGQPYSRLRFQTPGFYRLVRHPLYVGWFLAFWATPTMTMAHLLFAVMTTAYILVAIQLEERNLVDEFGETYREYRRRVPMLNPFASKRRDQVAGDAARAA